jgi:hypothetical protein
MTASYTRNIQGVPVTLTLIEVDPDQLKLDPTNPRVGFSMKQLDADQRDDPACTLLLTSQEDTEGLKRSIIISGGVQEPIYLRYDFTVAEGNRRVVATRAAKEEHPGDPRFGKMPAWLIPQGTPEGVVQDLLNEIHLGSVKGWAPYEKALQMRALLKGGLIHEEVAERYRMTAMEVKQHVEAANLMDRLYFPITENPSDADHRSKFSYFLEFLKNSRLRAQTETILDLPERFARWVRDGRVNTGTKVRRLPKVLDQAEALQLLEVVGFDAAEDFLSRNNPREQELYVTIEKARARLEQLTVAELVELAGSADRVAILSDLRTLIDTIMENVLRFQDGRGRDKRRNSRPSGTTNG